MNKPPKAHSNTIIILVPIPTMLILLALYKKSTGDFFVNGSAVTIMYKCSWPPFGMFWMST